MAEQGGKLSGQTIKGYELRDLIGSGGFGEVYRAYQPAVGREVAVKIILARYANDPDFVRRFEVEAQLVARLEHIHIVPLYDFWRDPDGAYLVMRWLRGGNLRDLLLRGSLLPLNFVRQLLDQISAALEVAHRSGVIHQDLKPDNVLLDDERNAFLADFGIAKDLQAHEADDQKAQGSRLGTPAYISPEQVLRRPITPQSDIYSLGIMLYELLTLQVPFDDDDRATLLSKHIHDPLPAVQILRPDLPSQLTVVLWRACAKDPEARYPSALDLAAEFREALSAEVQFAPGYVVPEVRPSAPTADLRPAQMRASDTMLLYAAPEIPNPFKGLRPFFEADAPDFFGREALVTHLLQEMRQEADVRRFLCVIGPSGSGKSSLIRAGLIPAIRRGMLPGSEQWYITQMTPDVHPFKALESALLQIALQPLNDLAQRLRDPAQGLLETIRHIVPSSGAQVLLFIDQFEEVFSLVADEAERAAFLQQLSRAVADPHSPLRILITLRADFYDRPLLYADFGALVKTNTEVVLPLTPAELEQAIVGPVERAGLRLERGLVPAIVAEVSEQPGALPLLQYALTELFERRVENTLTLAAYEEIGGIAGSLARRAQLLYEGLDAYSQVLARRLFLQIITSQEGSEDLRRRAARHTLLETAGDRQRMTEVIEMFGRYRLLAFDHEPETRAPTVEIAHEALIRHWTQLREWLANNRDELRAYRRLAAASADWLRAGRDPSFLATGSRLDQFKALGESDVFRLSTDEAAYIEAGLAQRQQALRRLRLWIGALVAGLVLVTGLAIVALSLEQQARSAEIAALQERDRADEQARISRSRELAITSLTSTSPDLALLLSLEAIQAANTFEARSSLLSALRTEPRLYSFLTGHEGGIRALRFDAQRDMLATAGQDRLIRLWDIQTRQLISAPLAGHEDWINALAFDPQGRYLASAGSDGLLQRWDLSTGAAIKPALQTDTILRALALSPDGEQILVAGDDGRLLRWDAVSGEAAGAPLFSHEGIVYAVAYGPDGRWLVSAGDDNAVRLWSLDAAQNATAETLYTHANWVLSLAVSPDGRWLASAGADRAIIVWDLAQGRVLHRLENAHENWIRDLAFDPAHELLVSAGADGVVRLWNLQSGTEWAAPLRTHQDAVWAVDFSADGTLLASGDADGTALIWDLTGSANLEAPFARQDTAVLALAFSPDGEYRASAGGDPAAPASVNPIYLWQADSELALLLEGHSGPVISLATSLDGLWLASSGAEGLVIVWDARTGTPEHRFVSEAGPVNQVRFSPDSRSLIGAGADGTLWHWSLADEQSQSLYNGERRLVSLAISPDGKLIASGDDTGAFLIWDAQSGELVHTQQEAHDDSVTVLAFSPDGRQMLSGSRDSAVLLWDTERWTLMHEPLMGHSNWVLSAAFSPDGQMIASGSRDGTLILWDVAAGRALGEPMKAAAGDWVNAVAFDPTGRSLLTGSRDGWLLNWQVRLSDWQQIACRIANRPMTTEEWQRYMGQTSYRESCQD